MALVVVLSPSWFYGVDSVFELLLFVIALVVSAFSFKVFRISGKKPYYYFGLAFLLISCAFLLKSVTNVLIYYKLIEHTQLAKLLRDINIIYHWGFLLHALLILTSYMILIILSLRIKDKKTVSLLFLIVALSVIVTHNQYLLYYMISFVLLIYIVAYFYKNYKKNRKLLQLLLFSSFLSILVSQFFFLMTLFHKVFYVIAHLIQLLGYLLLATYLVLVLKK